MLCVIVDDQVLRHLGEMNRGQGSPREELGDEIPVADGVQAVQRHACKAQLLA